MKLGLHENGIGIQIFVTNYTAKTVRFFHAHNREVNILKEHELPLQVMECFIFLGMDDE